MSLDPTRPGDNWYATIIIVDSDGVPAAPDSTPTAILRKNGVEQTTTVTVTQCTDASSTARDGEYRLSATVPSGWSPGDVVDARVEVTLSSVTYSIYTAPTRLVSAGPEALPSYPSGTSGGLPVLQQMDSSHLAIKAFLRQGWTLQITSPTFLIGDTTLYNPDTLQPGSVFRIWSAAGGFAAGEDVYVVDNANTVVRGYNHTTEQDWAIGDNLSFVGFSAPNMVEILNGQGLTTTRAAKLDNADVAVSTIKAKTDTLPASPAAVGSAMTLADGAAEAIADQVESQIMDDDDSSAVLQAIVNKINEADPDLSGLTLEAIAQAVRDVLIAGAAAGSLGKLLADNLDAKVSSRMASDATIDVDTDAIADAVADAIINAGGAISLSVQSPVLTSSSVQLVQGDSYYVADSRALSWTLSGGPSLVGATATLNAVSNSDGTTALGVPGTISGSTITVELASSDTSGLQIGTEAYTFNVTITLANGHIFTPIVGTIQVLQSAQ